MTNINIGGYKDVATRNVVTMTLGEFLEYRDAKKLVDELRVISINSKKTYGCTNERDLYDIGSAALRLLNIPITRDDETPEEAPQEESDNV